jgi:hypothetical protein
LIELLVVVCVISIVAGLVLPVLAGAREQARRSSCGGNLGNVIKCCHLYSDAPANMGIFPSEPTTGVFPIYVAAGDHATEQGDGHTTNGLLAISQLYDAYIKDHRVFSCPSRQSDTKGLARYTPPAPPTLTGYTNYGYDPGHSPIHATAGVFGDMGLLHPKNGNSSNHGRDGPGENVAIGAGSVEWWDSALQRATKDANANAWTDRIYFDDLSPGFPEELETCIIK